MLSSSILFIFAPEKGKNYIVKKLRKDIFLKSVAAVVALLFVVRLIWPEVRVSKHERPDNDIDSVRTESSSDVLGKQVQNAGYDDSMNVITESTSIDSILRYGHSSVALLPLGSVPHLDFSRRHPIFSVPSYHGCFPDVQDVHFPAAVAGGVSPVQNRVEAEHRKKDLLYVGANPYYLIDPSMRSSIPYLVPKASHLLQHIGRRFLDSLAVKQIPLHTIIVTSVLRTEEDVARLRRINGNASEQSCHRFGTTFDISYNRYHTVAPPDDPNRRAVRNDSLKFVLSEVLRDCREEGLCYVKYEVKQGCFHVTVR